MGVEGEEKIIKNMKPKPDEYNKFNILQVTDASNAISNFEVRSKCPEQGLMIVDIGSGTGNVTRDIALNHFSKYPLNKIVGLDKEKNMVEYARNFNSHPKIEYDVFNMDKTELPLQLVNKFNVLTSFYSFHWMDQPLAIKNINKLLVLGGEALIMFCLKSTYTDLLSEMKLETKWRSYLQDVPVSYSYNLEGCNEYVKFLEENGFAIRRIEMKNSVHRFNTVMEAKKFYEHINVFKSHLSEEMFDEFLKEVYERNIKSMREASEFDFKDINSEFAFTIQTIEVKKIKDI